MTIHDIARRMATWLALLVIAGGIMAGCGATAATNGLSQGADIASTTVTMLHGLDVFDPFIMPVTPGTAVTFHNADAIPHVVMTTPEKDIYLNLTTFDLTVQPGQSATLTLAQPGLYHYYDATVATWSTSYLRVIPDKGVPRYPMAMEGVIWVQGTVAGLPDHAFNYIVHLKDQIANNFVAISTGGTVTWHNYDTDVHFFQTVLGWDAPINPTEVGISKLLGSDAAPPDGESRSITFTQPGLYYYFCFTHALVDPNLLRVYARDFASEYPVPMEGFVLVTGT
jgi:plastocyanin